LSFAGGMAWEILWALSFGFGLSALAQAVVSRREVHHPPDSQQLPPLPRVADGRVLLVSLYAAMAAAGLAVELLFEGLGIERTARNGKVLTASDLELHDRPGGAVFLCLAAVLVCCTSARVAASGCCG
jgi:hypothetical protein